VVGGVVHGVEQSRFGLDGGARKVPDVGPGVGRGVVSEAGQGCTLALEVTHRPDRVEPGGLVVLCGPGTRGWGRQRDTVGGKDGGDALTHHGGDEGAVGPVLERRPHRG